MVYSLLKAGMIMNQTTAVVASGPGRRRFRWTIAWKITTLAVVAVGLLAVLGVLAVVSVAELQRLSAQQAALAVAESRLVDLDMQESNVTIGLNRALLATTDAERQNARAMVSHATDAVHTDFDQIDAVHLP